MMKVPSAELITIGDEILYGHILDTNTQWMCQKITEIGIRVQHRTTLGDNREDILRAFDQASKRSDLVLITGGLGPTPDDLTKPCLAEFLNVNLVEYPEALKDVKSLFKGLGREMLPVHYKQAELPEGTVYLQNKQGTAPGMWVQKNGAILVSLPGVPSEMKYLMNHQVMPRLKESFVLPAIHHIIVKTAGIGESWLQEKIIDWENNLPENIKLAYLPSIGQVKLRLTATANSREEAETHTEEQIKSLLPLIRKYVYGFDAETLESAIGKSLLELNMSLATAESCTGGYLAHLISSVAGCSRYFKGSIIAYSNEVKLKELGVAESTLTKYGAVSEETVKEMAAGVAKRLACDVGMATSGVAGPGGGSEEKPVGTVCIAVYIKGNVVSKTLNLGDRGRENNIHRSSLGVLNLLRLQLNTLGNKH